MALGLIKVESLENNNIVKCNELNDDMIFEKYNISQGDIIETSENQYVCLIEKGKILDIKDEKGTYIIKEIEDTNVEIANIRKAEKEELCILFLNKSEIKNNKYYLKQPIEYIDWTFKEEPLVTKIKGEGEFYFKINNVATFLENMVIGLRTHYSKQELIEQIRPIIVNSIIEGIKEISNEYKINIDQICEKSKEIEIKLSKNVYDEKLLTKGIKITFFDIEKLEVDDETRYVMEKEENESSKRVCKNCGNVLEEGDSYCKNCGTLNI